VASIAVILDGVDHMCCGEHREVGDVVTILVQNYKGTLHEERHGEGVVTQPITGTVTANPIPAFDHAAGR
jgi:hypothetical protein